MWSISCGVGHRKFNILVEINFKPTVGHRDVDTKSGTALWRSLTSNQLLDMGVAYDLSGWGGVRGQPGGRDED